MNALALRPAGLVRDAKAAALMRAVTAEAVAVGRAVGARLNDGLPDEVIARYLASPPDQANSMLMDRRADRPLEIDARNGVIVRLGERAGVRTPLNAMAIAILAASVAIDGAGAVRRPG